MQSSLHRRLLQLALIPALVFALLLAVYFALTQIWQSQQQFRTQTQVLTQAVTPSVIAALRLEDQQLLERAAQDILNVPQARAVQILHQDGSVTLGRGAQVELADQNTDALPNTLTRFQDGNWHRLIAPLYIDADATAPQGWLQIDFSTNDLTLNNYRLISLGALISVGGVGLIWLLVLALGRPITRPFYQVLDTLRDLSEGRLDQRTELARGGDLRALGEGVNRLAEDLENARDEMQQSVDQATQDLRETLETLEIQNIQLSSARREAMEANEAKTQFLANMSHEIRTPLNGVIGFIKLLDRTSLDQKQRDYVTTIRQSSESLLVIINDILDFLKLDAGKLELERRQINLRELVEDVLDMMAPIAHEKSLELAIMVYDDVPQQVVGDPLRLRQVITNLVNNAVKFTDEGHVVVRVASEGQSSTHHRVRLAVTDTGPGISRDKQKTLFRAFSQADASTSRRFGGTGLGLIICQRLVQQMSGKIEVDSVEGEGATFAVLIDFEQAASTEQEQSSATVMTGVRTWLWEPEELPALALRHHLERWGMTVDSLETGTLPDLTTEPAVAGQILLLTWRPEQAEWLHTLTQQAREQDTPVLIMTRHNDQSDALRELEQLASGMLTKPVRQRRLRSLCEQVLKADSQMQADTPARLPRILLVDDNETNRKLLEAFLSDYGIQPDEAEDGSDAMAHISQHHYDLVFMDIQMPVMDGITATREIRRHETADKHLPVIALTAHALPQEQDDLMRSGFDDYITKPISEQQLIQSILHWTGTDLQAGARHQAPSLPQPAGDDVEPAPEAGADANLPVDFAIGLRRAGGKGTLAREMFQGLLDQLYESQWHLASLLGTDQDMLLERVHSLHGVTRYCGVMELEATLHELESLLKQQETDQIPGALAKVQAAMDRVLQWSEQENWEQWLEEASNPAL
ncbi:MAG: response regulator [Natronospirillum sp.]|uniref:response regulator n=1 Tax=Natronospirillum sp. TaxID=2812955 RepID=UPI0025E0AB9C|nr:response regulator [Natronospirillum sp.]MCH8550491.1 response regulator [Natronospirillum sp.]